MSNPEKGKNKGLCRDRRHPVSEEKSITIIEKLKEMLCQKSQ